MSHVHSMTTEPVVLTEKQLLESGNKVGILGGTFNPPHIGHLIIAEHVRDQLGLERMLFMPSYTPPHKKQKETLDPSHRVQMLKHALAENAGFDVELSEIQRKGKSYTFDTLKALKEAHPDTEYYFVIGADMVEDLSNWYKIGELIQLVQFVAVGRPGYELQSSYPIIKVDVPKIDISSTLIRQKVREGCSIKYLVTDETEAYIRREGLYLNEEK